VTAEDALTFHRPPREYPAAVPSEPVRIAPPPTLPPPPHTSLIQILFPVVGGVGLVGFALVYKNSLFLIVAGVMIVLLLAFSIAMRWSQKRAHRKRAAEDARKYTKYLRERDLELASSGELQRGALARLYPEPGRLWALLVKRAGVWERRPGHRDFLHVRIGTGAVPLDGNGELDLGMNPLADYQPQSLQEARRMVERRNVLRGEPVVVGLLVRKPLAPVPLRGVGRLEGGEQPQVVRGAPRRELGHQRPDPPPRALAVARHGQHADVVEADHHGLPAQHVTALHHAPRLLQRLRLLTAFEPADAPQWDWGKWLPHQQADPGVPGKLLFARGPEELEALLEPELRPRLEQLRRIAEAGMGTSPPPLVAPELIVIVDGYRPDHPANDLPSFRELLSRARP
jgi:S-DNA-T family DNA segregation ATPase FtsK/SpoIIIE